MAYETQHRVGGEGTGVCHKMSQLDVAFHDGLELCHGLGMDTDELHTCHCGTRGNVLKEFRLGSKPWTVGKVTKLEMVQLDRATDHEGKN